MIKFGLAVAFSSHGRQPPIVNLIGLAGLDLAISSRGSRFLKLALASPGTRLAIPQCLNFPLTLITSHITQHRSSQPSQASGFLPLSLWLTVNQTTASCRSRTPRTFYHDRLHEVVPGSRQPFRPHKSSLDDSMCTEKDFEGKPELMSR